MTHSSNHSDPNISPTFPPNDTPNSETAYNVVTDLVTGVNVRSNDNKFQAIFIACTVLALALTGALLAFLQPAWNLPAYGGAIIGAFLGLVLGVLASGVILMIYRAVRHMQGKHD
jgi:uncharacterized membrane protein SpoIIM required for sporulation